MKNLNNNCTITDSSAVILSAEIVSVYLSTALK